MKQLLGALLSGQSLRHRPVAIAQAEQRPARALATFGSEERDVTSVLYPLSLSPLRLGLFRSRGEPPPGTVHLRMKDEASGQLVGTIDLRAAGELDLGDGFIDVLQPTGSSVHCAPFGYRAWKYLLAWRQVRRTAADPHAFKMRFADLRALNVFYMMPRPVHFISVVHGDCSNIFPMDLVGPLGEDRFLLALRLTSPSIEPMAEGGRIVAAGAPAALKEPIYRLGAHHKQRSIDWDSLPVAIRPSPMFGIPTAAEALDVRELEVLRAEPIGSHMLFVARIAGHSPGKAQAQLCHISDMYARWSAAHGRPFADA